MLHACSHDHRGVPGAPGRVVTLIPFSEWQTMQDDHRAPEDCVTWGVAYRIADEDVEQVKAHLDYREKDGYSVHHVDVYPSLTASTPVVRNALCYIGTTHNESFLGYASESDLARQIATAVGPSGPNSEYLLRLAECMRQMAPHAVDTHLFALEARVRALLPDVTSGVAKENSIVCNDDVEEEVE
ncbi:hypothetical protein RI367_003328 [Sorochytrium milnesiophthora]